MYPKVRPKYTVIEIMLIKIALVGLGAIIGISAGFYFAVRTLPLPTETTNYILGE